MSLHFPSGVKQTTCAQTRSGLRQLRSQPFRVGSRYPVPWFQKPSGAVSLVAGTGGTSLGPPGNPKLGKQPPVDAVRSPARTSHHPRGAISGAAASEATTIPTGIGAIRDSALQPAFARATGGGRASIASRSPARRSSSRTRWAPGIRFTSGLLARLHATGRLERSSVRDIPADSLRDCLAFANKAAAITCTRRGPAANPGRDGGLGPGLTAARSWGASPRFPRAFLSCRRDGGRPAVPGAASWQASAR
jgi:hypothetical protein